MVTSTSPKPSYHLCPDFSIATPPDGHLTLGSILLSLDVDGVAHPLNLNAAIGIPPEHIFPRNGPDSKTGFTRTLKELRSVEASIWAKIFSLQGLGGTFNFLNKRTDDESLTVEEIQTRYFSPTEEYMTKSLELPDVAGFVTATQKEDPVYMVTGLKVAIGAKLSKVESKTKNLKAEIGASDPQGMVSAGGSGGYASEDTSAMGFDGSTPFVLGIRVRKIWWEKGVRKTSDKVPGRALDNDRAHDKASPVSGARFVEDFLVDDDETPTAEKIFANEIDGLGIEPSNWALP
ncbi:major facilitator superfamily transporter [Fusarium mundagurra]|uniref:Major facilitator superfamily transporter n=1 Tax=Fusarium mundagurra TaxID=1567541 RepID=A0A8H5XY20_9HYPO|nr:major facilitator superfamily transporter [Fusarium mundagurra]